MKEKKFWQTTSASLHIMAMAFMLCDHLWATVVPGNAWLTCVGRVTYPIFAFLAVEGYFHTGDLKKYVKRLLITAALSEIPFNLIMGGGAIYPFQQNVIWTILLGLAAIHLNEKARKKGKLWVRVLTAVGTVAVGGLVGQLTMVDYGKAGVLTLLVFYFFRGRKWWQLAGQLAGMYYLNLEVIRGLTYEIALFGGDLSLPRQAFALLALIPIWLYRGEQGHHSKAFRWLCYSFYPAHMLVLGLIQML